MASVYFPAMFSNSFHPPRRTRLCCPNQGREPSLNLWRLLDDHPLRQPLHPLRRAYPLFRTDARPEPVYIPKQPWVHRLKIKGYDPRDIEVKVDGKKVIIHAVHEEKNGDNMDRYETKRTVNIPDSVIKEKIGSFLLDGGHLIISAPYNVTEEKEDSKKTEAKEHQIDIQHEGKAPVDQAISNERAGKLEGENNTTGAGGENKVEVEVESNDRTEEQVEADVSTSLETFVNEIDVKGDGAIDQGEESTSQVGKDKIGKETTAIRCTSVEEEPTEKYEQSNEGDDINLEESYVITSPPPSPLQAEDNGGLFDKLSVAETDNEETKTKKEEDTQMTTENFNSLSPLMDSKEIVAIDGEQVYQVSMNLKNFKPENVSIKFKDNVLSVDAEKEWNSDGILTTQKVHRKFIVPENGDGDKVSAKMSDNGLVKIFVPLQDGKQE